MTADSAVGNTNLLSEGIAGLTGNGLAAMILICGVAVAVLLFLAFGWLQRRTEKTESEFDDIVMAAIGTPAVIAVLVIAGYLAIQAADLPAGLEWIKESKYLNAFFVIIGAWITSSFAYDFISVYGHRIAARTETDFDDRMISLGLVITKYVIWFVAILIILRILEIDVTPLLAGAGIVTLAVALAAQDIFSNFFGGAVIAVDKPFKLHDRVKIDKYYGDIVTVGPRSTPLKDPRQPDRDHPEHDAREQLHHQLFIARHEKGGAYSRRSRIRLRRQPGQGDTARGGGGDGGETRVYPDRPKTKRIFPRIR